MFTIRRCTVVAAGRITRNDTSPMPPDDRKAWLVVQCALVMKMHMLNPLTTREFSAQKLEETSDAASDGDSSERWLTLAVRPAWTCFLLVTLSEQRLWRACLLNESSDTAGDGDSFGRWLIMAVRLP